MGKKRSNPKRNKIEVMADPAWIDRVMRHAERLGLNISAYMRLATTERMDRDDAAQKGGAR
jgi:hypothetical protein